jgi:hypothetical protein
MVKEDNLYFIKTRVLDEVFVLMMEFQLAEKTDRGFLDFFVAARLSELVLEAFEVLQQAKID